MFPQKDWKREFFLLTRIPNLQKRAYELEMFRLELYQNYGDEGARVILKGHILDSEGRALHRIINQTWEEIRQRRFTARLIRERGLN